MSEIDPLEPFRSEDLESLRKAASLLESPGFFIRAANLLGSPVEYGIKKLPNGAQEFIQEATTKALNKALDLALRTLDPSSYENSWDRLHKLAVATTGGAGGFFGLPGLAFELPLSTGIMLRSIADVARSEGEDLELIEAKLACLEVFALGGSPKDDDAANSSYLLIRALLAREIAQASEFLAERGIAEKGAPVVLRLIIQIAERFGIQVAEKAAAELIPVIGAIGGASINLLFLDHFQDMARGHFTYRRLERCYGAEIVEDAYREIVKLMNAPQPGRN